mmetsp:Transcript_11309/g.16903  ORF Transcript_11309/g.16903 Transcript_11309/m.16903 type:complete len:190 (+) Transcript_11309:307-876(+)
MQTSLPFTKQSKLKLYLDSAFGEAKYSTSKEAREKLLLAPHSADAEFKGLVDEKYKELLDGKEPHPSMKNVAEAIEKKFGFKAGRSIVIFSHASPCIYLAAALSQKKLTEINVASPCCMFKLTQSAPKKPYEVERNGRIDHLSVYGRTTPWHQNMKMKTACLSFGWPPPEDEAKLKAFLDKYHNLYAKN